MLGFLDIVKGLGAKKRVYRKFCKSFFFWNLILNLGFGWGWGLGLVAGAGGWIGAENKAGGGAGAGMWLLGMAGGIGITGAGPDFELGTEPEVTCNGGLGLQRVPFLGGLRSWR